MVLGWTMLLSDVYMHIEEQCQEDRRAGVSDHLGCWASAGEVVQSNAHNLLETALYKGSAHSSVNERLYITCTV